MSDVPPKQSPNPNDQTSDLLDTKFIIISSLAYVISMAWSSFFQNVIDAAYPASKTETRISVKFFYAVQITLFILILAALIAYFYKAERTVVSSIKEASGLTFASQKCTYYLTDQSLSFDEAQDQYQKCLHESV